MKTLLVLALSAASLSAAQVEYTLNNGTRDLLTFVTNGYLPNVQAPDPRRGIPTWILQDSQTVVSPCKDLPARSTCQIEIALYAGFGFPNPSVGISAIVTRENGEQENRLMGISAFPLDALDHDADVREANNRFTIKPTTHVATVTPEPKTWHLALAGMSVSYFVWLRRGLLFRN
jgi:hypothetical protein